MFNLPIGPDHFATRAIGYDTNRGLYEAKKNHSSNALVNWVLKFIRYVTQPSARLACVVKGLEIEVNKMITQLSGKDPNEIINYLLYVTLFKIAVVNRHNASKYFCRSVLDTTRLDEKVNALSTQFFSQVGFDRLSHDAKAATIEFLKVGRLHISENNFSSMARLAKSAGSAHLQKACDAFGAEKLASSMATRFDGLDAFLALTESTQLMATRKKLFAELNTLDPNEWQVSSLVTLEQRRVIFQECPTLKRQCEHLLLQKLQEARAKLAEEGKKALAIDSNDLLTHLSADYQRRVIGTLQAAREAVYKTVAAFHKAREWGFDGYAKEIYDINLRAVAYLSLPIDDNVSNEGKKILDKVEIARLNANSHRGEDLNARQQFLSDNLALMRKLYPQDPLYVLLEKHANYTSCSPKVLQEIFLFAIIPFIRAETAVSPVLSCTLSIEEQLLFFQESIAFFSASDNHVLQNFVERSIDVEKVITLTENELLKPWTKETYALYERVTLWLFSQRLPYLYPLALMHSKIARAQIDRVNQVAVDYLKKEHPDRKKDFLLKVADKEQISCHKEMLAKFSPYFHKVIQADSKKNELQIQLSQEERVAFQDLIQYIYTKKVALTSANVRHILKLAKTYQIQPLLPLVLHWYEWVETYCKNTKACDFDLSLLDALFEQATLLNLRSVCNIIASSVLGYALQSESRSHLSDEQVKNFKTFAESHSKEVRMCDLDIPSNETLTYLCTHFPHIEHLKINAIDQSLRLQGDEFRELTKLKELQSLNINSPNLVVDLRALGALRPCLQLSSIAFNDFSCSPDGYATESQLQEQFKKFTISDFSSLGAPNRYTLHLLKKI